MNSLSNLPHELAIDRIHCKWCGQDVLDRSTEEQCFMRAPITAKDLTDERKSTHGDWMHQSAGANILKKRMRQMENWENLTPSQQEALDMIQTKVSRILSGNPKEPDHWDDIAGYAYLGKGGHGQG